MPILALTATALLGFQAKTMTLDEALNLGDKNAFSIKIAKNRRDRARTVVAGANAALLPKIDFTGNSNYQEQEFAAIPGVSGAFFGPSGWNNYNSVSLALTQSVDINRLAPRQLDVYKFQLKAEEENILTETNALHNNIRQQYFALLMANDLVNVQNERYAAATERLAKAKIRFEAGAVPKFEVIRLEDDQKKAEQDLVVAKANVSLARQGLNNIIGIDIATDYDPANVDRSPEVGQSPDELVKAAMTDRSEIRQGEDFWKSLQNAAIVATVGQKPGLTLSAVETNYISPPAGSQTKFQQIAAKFTWNLWDSGVTHAQVEAARSDADQAEIQLHQTELGVAFQVRSAHTNLQTAATSRGLAAKNVELAKESLRLAQLRYDAGAGILLDVITAQSDLTAAETGQVSANYQYLQAYAALQRAVGSDDLLPHPPVDPAKALKSTTPKTK